MTVSPYLTNLFQDSQELYQLLTRGKQQAIAKDCPQIVSISQEIPLVDPLAILQAIAKPNQLQFYFEQSTSSAAVVAIESAISLKILGKNRFNRSQDFIQSVMANTTCHGQLNLPFSGPHFFCSFTFFEDKLPLDAPFPSATIFLPRWQISSYKNQSILVANIEISHQVNIESILKTIWNDLKLINSSHRSLHHLNHSKQNQLIQQDLQNPDRFKSSVSSALKLIEANQLRKIVLANAIDVVLPHPFNLVNSLDNLRQLHPDCYIFSTSNGKGHNFIGASPERLITIRNHQLVTDALAGSAPRGKTATEDADFADRLLSSEKERREHQFVLDFITERLSQLGLIPQHLSTTQLLKLSNIQHLWTPIQAQLPIGVHPLEIVEKLHPTPAVAGVPTKIAQAQIRHYEICDRSLYAAPLGWVDYQGNCEFIVGIRSALIECHHLSPSRAHAYRARLYAGAGIVAGSDPNKELAEIQLKLQVLLKALL
ncbi:MAG TPA: isochorismate synthase [Cyanobacteria bacterium UBA11149]|nr:isochorismate synthase [Cyanobacteria bacterium UBA11367]HBE57383.1 isochorismate synthase [Cyanobacteria bacterium UBA11366]HBK66899.1 isochorismate synthase [Cyanobacteria bacterium UBA11166]HBR73454.1 isochorismate synthase [Cyanobacteria bacterium UBA11159]HBS69708.1 isochorismate synthase [Cyanobacteria bacterium UBA11153]HBW88392.1 isochorismate synthase [Cyanobacteria bacterium UBA11149]HCA95495.1 isochorismate synthase [Cyanobacteria bacterium UBA9226]